MAKNIFNNESMREQNWGDVLARLESVFSDKRYIRQFGKAKDNWLEVPVGKVTAGILLEVKKLAVKC